MALSLVAGPIDIVPADPLESVVLVSSRSGLWLDDRGFYFVAGYPGSDHGFDLYVATLSGKAVRVGNRFGPAVGGLGWSADDGIPIAGDVWGNWVKLDLPATAPRSVWFTNIIPPVALEDRKLKYGNNRVWFAGYDELLGSAERIEYLFPDAPIAVGSGMMFYAGEKAGHQRWWCLDEGNGRLYLYDSTAKTEATDYARTGFGSAVRSAGYSVQHDVFMAVRRDTGRTPNVDQLYVYANEPAADSLSAPGFTPIATRGKRSVLYSRVLGDLNEPCQGRSVTFAVDAGSVNPATVATDADGYARTSYFAPTDGHPTGAVATATLEE